MNLTDEQRKFGVMTSSCGNHGVAMSYHATQLGIPCMVVMPVYTAIGKMHKCEQFGARVVAHGTSMNDAKRHAMMLGKEKRMTYING